MGGPLIKLFASDLDGTLFNFMHQIDGGILRRLRRVIAAGRHVAPATGRWARSGAELGFGDLPVEVVGGNGAFIYAADGELLRSVEIAPEAVEELLEAFPRCCFTCIATEGTFVRGSREDQMKSLHSRGLQGHLLALSGKRTGWGNDTNFDQTTADVLAHRICKVNFRDPDPGVQAELTAFVEEHADAVVNASFDGELFEVTEKSVNKGEAVAWLARHLGIGEDEVAVYGDGGNDIEMLARFEHAYATSNARDDAKRAAGHVIGNCAFHAVPRHMLATVRREGEL